MNKPHPLESLYGPSYYRHRRRDGEGILHSKHTSEVIKTKSKPNNKAINQTLQCEICHVSVPQPLLTLLAPPHPGIPPPHSLPRLPPPNPLFASSHPPSLLSPSKATLAHIKHNIYINELAAPTTQSDRNLYVLPYNQHRKRCLHSKMYLSVCQGVSNNTNISHSKHFTNHSTSQRVPSASPVQVPILPQILPRVQLVASANVPSKNPSAILLTVE